MMVWTVPVCALGQRVPGEHRKVLLKEEKQEEKHLHLQGVCALCFPGGTHHNSYKIP